ncbi:TRAP transporter small permease [Oryzicola mucosus]|uniref:TRAP transporter small permease protein n=1 Tax=Oryzicola mucosus TaxID=2767425 RepID=A0A8J6Q2L5_9HYPH|nr:TRAP transporter small permease [Oryzicola mucosus]MBD0415085.1 TRAP transporter small permease [Oryzicola mucosus]
MEATATAAGPSRNPLFHFYANAIKFIAGSSMLVIVVIMIVQVAARYLFNASLIWAEELCRYILIWQTFLLIGFAYHQGELVALDMLGKRVNPYVKLLIRFIVSAPVCVFLYFIIVSGWNNAVRFTGQSIPAVDFIWTSLTGAPAGLPVFWVYVAVPVGCSVLLIHFVVRFALDAYRVATGQDTHDQPAPQEEILPL